MMIQGSVSVARRSVNMINRRYCYLCRVGITIIQRYSTRTPQHGLEASAQFGATKTKRKELVNENDNRMGEESEPGASDTAWVKVVGSKMKAKDLSDRAAVQSEGAEGKKLVLHDAVDPRELEWREFGAAKLSSLPGHYLMLAKFRLTSLVVLTSVGGYMMAPHPLEVGSLLALAIGTGLVSSAANAINQFLEAPFDAQMPRTRNRALVRGLLTPVHAMGFAVSSAISGSCILWAFTNSATTALGILNLFLYTSAYTPLKRVTIANTWVGSIVGAIPPLMGWAACSGGSLEAGAWLMAAVLYAWQFPHFNALSWNLRQEYSRAGYRMMAVTNPELCRKTALRYSIGMVAICLAAPVLSVTTWTFAFDSLPPNLYLTYLAWKFYKESDSRSSRKLFRFTLLHLPVIMFLMLISKKHHSGGPSQDAATAVASGSSAGADSVELKSVMSFEKNIVS